MTIISLVEDAFAADGPVAMRLDGYRQQTMQVEYAKEVARTLEHSKRRLKTSVAVLEAETGIGKTLGYLVPLLIWVASTKSRAAISTASVHLQEQILSPNGNLSVALKVTEELTGVILSSANRMGMRHFVNPDRALQVLDERRTKKERRLFDAFQRWLASPGPHIANSWLERYEQFPANIQLDEICCRPNDSSERLAPYVQHVEQAKNSDIVITNHSITVLHGIHRSVLESVDGKPITGLVLDEADRFASMAASLSFQQVPFSLLDRHLEYVQDILGDDNKTGSGRLIKTARACVHHTTASISNLDPSTSDFLMLGANKVLDQSVMKRIITLEETLSSLSPMLSTHYEAADVEPEVIAEIELYRSNLAQFVKASSCEHRTHQRPAFHWSSVHRKPSLLLIPLNPGSVFRLLLRNDRATRRLDATIVTSATLGDGQEDSLGQMARDLGIFQKNGNLVVTRKFNIDAFGHIKMVIAGDIPPPTKQGTNGETNPEWLDSTARLICEAAGRRRRTLVLCLSMRDTAELARRVRDILGDRVIAHTTGMRLNELLCTYKRCSNGVLLSPAAWEGVDLPGLIDELIITRLPYLPANDPLYESIQMTYMERGVDEETARRIAFGRRIAEAKRKFRQGVGRAPRRPNDRVRLWIADPRFPVPGKDVSQNNRSFVLALPERYLAKTLGHASIYENAKIWRGDNRDVPCVNPW